MKKIFFKLLTLFILFSVLLTQADAGKLQDQINAGLLRPTTLRAISSLPKDDPNNLSKMTEMFLVDMGYPKDMIPVKFFQSGLSGYEGDITGGYFRFQTGEIYLNPMLKKAPVGYSAGVIRHELDHFQKSAQLCKSIGIENYKKIFGGEQINVAFWQKAMVYTKVPAGFDYKKYIAGMQKYTYTTDMTSPYYIYDNKTDSRRNIFEISAYNLSEAMNEYFKIPNRATNLEKVAAAFNNVDWKIYNLSKKYPVLSGERVAIFDYFYTKTLVQRDASMQEAFQTSMKTNNMNTFWAMDKTKRSSFYNNANIDAQTTNQIIALLNALNGNIPGSLTIKQTKDILELKYLTLRSALKQSEAKGTICLNLNKLTNDYLKFLNTYAAREDGTRLKLLVTKLQLLQIGFQMPDGKTRKIGKPGDTEGIIKLIFNDRYFNEICKKQSKDKCLMNIVNNNKL